MWTASVLIVFIAIVVTLPQGRLSELQDSFESSDADVESFTPWTMLHHGTDYVITTDSCFTYFGPEGKKYVVDYVAGGGGFQPVHPPSKRQARGTVGETKKQVGVANVDSTIMKTLLGRVQVYYRITMVVLEPFIEAFNDRDTCEYKEISSNLVRAVDELLEDLEGRQSATVIKIEKREADVFSSKVTMDLGTVDYYDHGRIRNHLYSHIRNYHTLGPYKVSTEDFTFREFED